MKSIQSKILTVVISGLLIMTAIISYICVDTLHEVLHLDADRILENMCMKEATSLNDVLNDTVKSVYVMEHYASSELDVVSSLKNPDYLDTYLATTKNLFNEIALNTNGVEAFYLRLDPEYIGPSAGYYTGIGDDGRSLTEYIIADFSEFTPDNEEVVGWFYKTKNANKGIWLQPYTNYYDGMTVISYLMPFYDDEGVFAGVVGMDINYEYITEFVDRIPVYKNGNASVKSSDGTVVYNSNTHENKEVNPHTVASCELINGMTLELCADYKDIQKDLRPVLTNIILAFMCVLCVFIIYTIFVTRKIVAPLKKLTAAAQSIAEGETGVDISATTNDEIDTLSKVLTGTYERLKEYMNYINALAYRDSLTGLKNRTAYDEAVAELEKKINLSHPKFAVLVADINYLKKTNDTYGHDVGNELLIHTSRIICSAFKSSPVFRIGGDEFVVLLEGKDLENYHNLIKKMDMSAEKDYITVNDDSIPVSIARGVAVYNPSVDRVYQDVFNNADQAMYMRKVSIKEKINN